MPTEPLVVGIHNIVIHRDVEHLRYAPEQVWDFMKNRARHDLSAVWGRIDSRRAYTVRRGERDTGDRFEAWIVIHVADWENAEVGETVPGSAFPLDDQGQHIGLVVASPRWDRRVLPSTDMEYAIPNREFELHHYRDPGETGRHPYYRRVR